MCREVRVLAVAALALLAACGCERSPSDVVVARIGSVNITKTELEMKLAELPPYARQQYSGTQGAMEFLDKLVEEEVLYQAALAAGYEDDPEVRETVETVEKRAMIRAWYRDEIEAKTAVPEEEVQAYYDEHDEQFQQRASLRFRHIMTNNKREADEARTRVLSGEVFASVARDVSVHKGSKDAGGLMKSTHPGDAFLDAGMDAAFVERLFEWKAGEVTEPLRSSEGWHVVKIEEKVDEGKKRLEEVRASIVGSLTPARTRTVFNDRLAELREMLNAHINEEFFTGTAKTEEDLFTLAQETDDPVKRLGYYAELIQNYPDGDHAAEAQFMIGFIHSEELKRYDPARRAFERMIELYPDSELIDSAKWMIENMGETTPPFDDPSERQPE